jgi:small subunit ribosomal protein S20
VRSAVRTILRRVRAAVAAGDPAAATTAFRECISTLDKAAKRRIVHPNAARRHQSRLAKRLQRLGAKPA